MMKIRRKKIQAIPKSQISLSLHRNIQRYKVTNKIPVVFHNCSTFDYPLIVKQLAEEFKGQFDCLVENTEKYITFSVPIKKEHKNEKTSTYKLKFRGAAHSICNLRYKVTKKIPVVFHNCSTCDYPLIVKQ